MNMSRLCGSKEARRLEGGVGAGDAAALLINIAGLPELAGATMEGRRKPAGRRTERLACDKTDAVTGARGWTWIR